MTQVRILRDNTTHTYSASIDTKVAMRILSRLAAVTAIGLVVSHCGGDRSDSTVPSDTDDIDATEDIETTEEVDHGDDVDAMDDDVPDLEPPDDATDADDTTDADDATDADDTTVPPPPPSCTIDPGEIAFTSPVDADLGDWRLSVEVNYGGWTLFAPHGGPAVLEAPPACDRDVDPPIPGVRVGDGEPGYETSFGAFRIALDGRKMAINSNITWIGPSGDTPVFDFTESEASIAYPMADGSTYTVRFSLTEFGDVRIAAHDSEDRPAGELTARCRPNEGFFGLGTQVTGMDLRGRRYPLWTQEQGNGKPETPLIWPLENFPEAAYAPMGVWHSSYGYAALIGTDGFTALDLCATHTSRLAIRSYPEQPSFALVQGETPAERMHSVTNYVGRITEPTPWTFAPWNDAVGGPDRLEHVATTLREHGIPSSAIWSEDWIGGEQGPTGFRLSYAWEWDPSLYPDLPDNIDALHANGFAFLAYFNTFVPNTTRMFTEGEAGGYLVRSPDGSTYVTGDPAFRLAGLVDLTNPEARDWFAEYMRVAAEDLGVDGWMADFTEWMPADAVLHSGEDGWLYHNQYPLAYQRLTRSVLEEVNQRRGDDARGWTYFARSGWASLNGGTAGIAPTLWGGDQDTNWKFDDGFPTIVPLGVHAGLAGVAIFGTDIAGYSSLRSPNTTKELFYRWSAAGAFYPLMRTHHGSDECGNWAFDRDAETLDHYGRYASIHTLLYPLFQRLTHEAIDGGLPFLRHPHLVEPLVDDLWRSGGYQFFLGNDLLVAPVIEEGATQWDVLLPQPGWWPLFGDEPADGVDDAGTTLTRVTVDAPVTEIPVFVRPGTALILLGEVVDSFYGATAEDVSTLDDVIGHYRVALYPDADGAVATRPGDAIDITTTGTPSFAWEEALVEGAPLDSCDDSPAPCISGDSVTLEADTVIAFPDGATLTVTHGDAVSVTLALAGAAWGTLRAGQDNVDLTIEVPLPCE